MVSYQLVVITGASRGFGRACAVAIAAATRTPMHFVLIGRDSAELTVTKELVEACRAGNMAEVTMIDTMVFDLGRVGALKAVADDMFMLVPSETRRYHKVIFVNNAGSLGPLAAIGRYPGDNLAEMSAALDLNVTAACYLTSSFMERCAPGGVYAAQGIKKVVIVNVSSLAAVKAFGSWGVYCAGKAAREMFHKCLAEEVGKRGAEDLPQVRVLNYAPGPLDTNMQLEIREGASVDKETQEFYRGLKEQNQLVDAKDSAAKLVKIINFEKYASGDHIDFYESIEGIDTPLPPTTCCGCQQCTCGVDCACKALAKPQCDACGEA